MNLAYINIAHEDPMPTFKGEEACSQWKRASLQGLSMFGTFSNKSMGVPQEVNLL
jgi:hypothetical protein